MADVARVNGAQRALRWVVRAAAFISLTLAIGSHFDDVTAAEAAGHTAASLQDKYASSRQRLGSNPFQRPLLLDSSESAGEVKGDIHALINAPFDSAATSLMNPRDWCDILLLHVNTKSCQVSTGGAGPVVSLWIGTKNEQPLADAFRVNFAYRVHVRTANFLQVGLGANEGPMGTRAYRIVLEAIPLENGKTFIHLAYSYGFGTLGRVAMQAYLATAGRKKIGFTVVGTQSDGQARHIDGVRGLVERNTMRYYLAIEAFLGASAVAPHARFEKRIRDWYASTEAYPRQLHELEAREYLDMKRMENLRQQSGPT